MAIAVRLARHTSPRLSPIAPQADGGRRARGAAFTFLAPIIAAKVKVGPEPTGTLLISSDASPSCFFTVRVWFTGDAASALASLLALTDAFNVFLTLATEVRVTHTPTLAPGGLARLAAFAVGVALGHSKFVFIAIFSACTLSLRVRETSFA